MTQKKIISITTSNQMQALVAGAAHSYHIVTYLQNNLLPALVEQHADSVCLLLEIATPADAALNLITQYKTTFALLHMPIIALLNDPKDMATTIAAGADDFITHPANAAELRARIDLNVHRAKHARAQDPLTGLACTPTVTKIITQRLSQPLAILYVDIDYFKPYNDVYGFERGDKLIRFTAQVLCDTVKTVGNQTDFIGRVGGDDFIIVTTPNKAEALAHTICTLFDAGVYQFYDHETIKQKKITVKNRQNIMQDFPLASLSIGIVSNERRTLSGIGQIAQIAAELKQYAKTKPGGAVASNYVKDRRTQ